MPYRNILLYLDLGFHSSYTSHTDNKEYIIPSSTLLVGHQKIDLILSYKEKSNMFHKIEI